MSMLVPSIIYSRCVQCVGSLNDQVQVEVSPREHSLRYIW